MICYISSPPCDLDSTKTVCKYCAYLAACQQLSPCVLPVTLLHGQHALEDGAVKGTPAGCSDGIKCDTVIAVGLHEGVPGVEQQLLEAHGALQLEADGQRLDEEAQHRLSLLGVTPGNHSAHRKVVLLQECNGWGGG